MNNTEEAEKKTNEKEEDGSSGIGEEKKVTHSYSSDY